MKPKIAILGANAAILPLIQKAKERGYETHVFAWACGAPGETEADNFYPISLADKEAILEQCRKIGVCGVASITSDFAAPAVHYVARNLGLTCNPEKADRYARDKYLMRTAFRDAGLFVPPFCQADQSTDLSKLELAYPVMVKPTDSWSSRAVAKVNCKEELAPAVKAAIEQSLSGHAIIEGFVEGPEYSAECIAYHGECHILTFTQKITSGPPHFVELAHVQPSDIPLEKQGAIQEKIFRALKALGIENSAAHAEFRIMENGDICFMEIGSRMAGGRIGTDLTPISTGLDFVGMVLDVACGKAPSFEKIGEPTPVRVQWIFSLKDVEEKEAIKATHPELILYESPVDYNFAKEVVSNDGRRGYYLIKQPLR